MRRDGHRRVSGTTLLADAVAGSVPEHVRFGGVVPEVASRAHVEGAMVPPSRGRCGRRTRVSRTSTPSPSRRAPDWSAPWWWGWLRPSPSPVLGKPLYGVNHLSTRGRGSGCSTDRCLRVHRVAGLGGHSSILRVGDVTADVEPLGATIDDAAGEALPTRWPACSDSGFPGGRRSTLRPVTATGRRSHSLGG